MQQRETAAIPRLVVSAGERLLRRVVLDTPRLTIGRRPFNDLMLDDLTVSGEHAVIRSAGGRHTILDLRSRNGTLVNGLPVMQHVLAEGDRIDIGIYRLDFEVEPRPPEVAAAALPPAVLGVLSGPQAGSTLPLERPIVVITNGAGQVAVVARRRSGWAVTHLEGPTCPLVNGESIGLVSHTLRHGDLIELGGTIFQFQPDPPS